MGKRTRRRRAVTELNYETTAGRQVAAAARPSREPRFRRGRAQKNPTKKTHSGVDLHFKLGQHPEKPADVRSPLTLTLISSLQPACLRILCPSPHSYLGLADLFIFHSGSVPSVSTCRPVFPPAHAHHFMLFL